MPEHSISIRIIKSLAVWLLFSTYSIQTSAQCNPPQPPGLTCQEATFLCSLDGYCGTTDFFNVPNVPNAFCGTIESAQWFAFIADAEEVTVQIVVTNCDGTFLGDGLQAQIYQTDDCISFEAVSNCENPAQEVDLFVEAEDLIPGETYYLLIDGYFGDVCDYELVASDIQIPTPEIIPLASVICPPGSGPTSSCQRVCSFSTVVYQIENSPTVQWDVIGSDNFTVQGNSLTVNWGAAGFGEIYGFLPGENCNEDAFLCVEILPIPAANFTTDPPIVNNTLNICKGQSVQFFNQSANATQFAWDFGDLSVSNSPFPEHTFNGVGSFEVQLIAQNECNCVDTTSLTVLVENADIPPIECISSVCAGETATYTSPANCSGYLWNISSNGVVIAGGGTSDNFITIEWADGVDGEVSLELAACTQTFCNSNTTLAVPIIANGITIKGPEKVCQSDFSVYSIPNYSGVDISWSVSQYGTIISGQDSPIITVEWADNVPVPDNNQWVSVDFENCYLDCSGDGYLDVEILPDYFISGDILACENTTSTYSAFEGFSNDAVEVNWQVTDVNGQIEWESTAASLTADIDWTFGNGVFLVKATAVDADAYCTEEYVLFVEISDLPAPVLSVTGDQQVCADEFYTYEAFAAGFNVNYVWEINNGGVLETKTGAIINVLWSDTPDYGITVRRVGNGTLPCESEPFTYEISPLTNFALNGNDVVCMAEIANFSIATPFQNASYNWSLIPEDAGVIIEGQATDSIQIFWNESGNATVALEICDVIETIAVNIVGNTVPDLVLPNGLCPGETDLIEVVGTFSSYEWLDENEISLSTDPTIELTAGNYQLQVTEGNGCIQTQNFSIPVFPEPIIDLTVPAYLGICPGGNEPIILALENSLDYDYQWLFNGTPLGNTNAELTVSQAGEYQVQATSNDGCVQLSDPITIENCSDIGAFCIDDVCTLTVPNCNFSGTIDFDVQTGFTCLDKAFTSLANDFQPGSLVWSFGDGSGSADENPTHAYTEAGHYTVILLGEFADQDNPGQFCEAGIYQDVEVTAAARFSSSAGCLLQPVDFFDQTSYLPNHSIQSWDWNFGEPASPNNTSNLQNPTHNYSSTGSYFVVLTVTMDDGCTTFYSEQIEVVAPPTAAFEIIGNTCVGEAIEFQATNAAGVVNWDFDDNNSGDANEAIGQNAYHIFENPGNYTIEMTVSSINGCAATTTQDITVGGDAISGMITSNIPSPICEGSTIDLTAPDGGATYSWSIGAAGTVTNQTITVAGAGIYEVTVTDAGGCTYVPPPFSVEILELPVSSVQAIEFDDFGQPINYFENQYEICQGEDITLEVISFGNFTYEWSNGDTAQTVFFDVVHDTLLTVGDYSFDVTITDAVSGCTAVAGPIDISVHPFPNNVQIVSSQPLPVCEFSTVTLSVNNPNPILDYFWNTGEIGNSINVSLAGDYFVRAVNPFGCIGESNIITVQSAPDISKIPSGCLSRCLPDTICWPNIPDVVSFQWYFNGSPIGNPLSNGDELVIMETGDYYVEMTDNAGCVSTSDPLSLDLFEGIGEVAGQVYLDLNENGVVDAGDTLVNGINFFLLDNGSIEANQNSGIDGDFTFQDVMAGDYLVQLDTTSLQPGQGYTILEIPADLEGCGQTAEVVFLLIPTCVPQFENATFEICPDATLPYEGENLLPNTTQEFMLSNTEGCDSFVTVTVLPLPTDSLTLMVETCEGTTYDYNGTSLAIDSQTDFQFFNQNGCDSIMTVIVSAIPSENSTLNLSVCEGEMIEYEGVMLSGGEQMDFVLQNSIGCDSTVTVMVATNLPDNENVSLSACDGETIDYQGITLTAGETIALNLTNQNGCDSTVSIEVATLISSSAALTLSSCQGEEITYQNTILDIGTTTEFTLVNAVGCDSVVTVMAIETSPVSFDLLSENSCENAPTGRIQIENIEGITPPYSFSIDGITFQNELLFENLFSGSYQVILADANGCEFIEETTVNTNETLEVVFENATLDCNEPVLKLTPEIIAGDVNSVTYLWSDSTQNSTLTVSEPGSYWVEITNECGTERFESTVQTSAINPNELLHFPNVFSPNRDGINDEFYCFALPDLEIITFEMNIFDRWGNHIFQSNLPDLKWKGNYKDKILEAGVYVWFVEATVVYCGREFEVLEEGGVLLMR